MKNGPFLPGEDHRKKKVIFEPVGELCHLDLGFPSYSNL